MIVLQQQHAAAARYLEVFSGRGDSVADRRDQGDIVGFGTTLYANHDGTLNFNKTDEPVLNTRVGIRLPLIYGVETKFEVLYEYDGGAVEGVDDLDETYTLGIGYAW